MVDNNLTLVCPRCRKVMKKIHLTGVSLNVDYCESGCKSFFFDKLELRKILSNPDEKEHLLSILSVENQEQDELMKICPVCGTKMMKTLIGSINVEFDECYNCGGMFISSKILKDYIDKSNQINNSDEQAINLINSKMPENLKKEFYSEKKSVQMKPLHIITSKLSEVLVKLYRK